jgi:hypothetical protein
MKILNILLLLVVFSMLVNGQSTADKKIQIQNEKIGIEKLKSTIVKQEQDSIQLQEMILIKQKIVADKLEAIVKLTMDVEEETLQIKLLQEQVKKRKEVLQLMFNLIYMASEPTPYK